MTRILLTLALTLALILPLSGLAQERPARDLPMDASLLLRQDLAYHFSLLQLDSADGQRHYQLWIGQPNRPAPAAGYPALWMLDGNAAVSSLSAEQLEQLANGRAPVLIAVGYRSDQRFNRSGRTYDYTPRLPELEQQIDPLTGMPSGGVEHFLELLTRHMRPLVAARVPLDPAQQTLWGHSYGGLAVLQALFTRPTEFTTYAAASPSLWWHDGAITREAAQLPQRLGDHRASLVLMRGGSEPSHPGGSSKGDVEGPARQLAAQLRQVPGLQVSFKRFDNLQHGPMLPASLDWLMETLYGEKDASLPVAR